MARDVCSCWFVLAASAMAEMRWQESVSNAMCVCK